MLGNSFAAKGSTYMFAGLSRWPARRASAELYGGVTISVRAYSLLGGAIVYVKYIVDTWF